MLGSLTNGLSATVEDLGSIARAAIASDCCLDLIVSDVAADRHVKLLASRSLSRSTGEVERNIDDHILLAADESAPAGFEKDGPGVDAVPQCCGFGVAQETGVDAGIAESERFPVDAYVSILQWVDAVVGGVLEGEQVAAELPALERGDGDERFDRAVSSPGAVACE